MASRFSGEDWARISHLFNSDDSNSPARMNRRVERGLLNFSNIRMINQAVHEESIRSRFLGYDSGVVERTVTHTYEAQSDLHANNHLPDKCTSFKLTIEWNTRNHRPTITTEYTTVDDGIEDNNVPRIQNISINTAKVADEPATIPNQYTWSIDTEADKDFVAVFDRNAIATLGNHDAASRMSGGPQRRIDYVEEQTPHGVFVGDWYGTHHLTRQELTDMMSGMAIIEENKRQSRLEKSKNLLLSFLNEAEKREFAANRPIYVQSKTMPNVKYEIDLHDLTDRVGIYVDNYLISSICVVPRDMNMPVYDGILSKLLMLKNDEELFFKIGTDLTLFREIQRGYWNRENVDRRDIKLGRGRLETMNVRFDSNGNMMLS